jgi:DNA modification methylase
LSRIFKEVYRVLVPGGRACVNVANVGRKPYLPLHLFVTEVMLEAGFVMRGEVIWDKSASAGTSTAWGSWCSPANPTLRDVHEYLLIFSKGEFGRECPAGRNGTITSDEFLRLTKSVWSFGAASAKKIGHPAPFPVELPRRLIELYTFSGEVVLDPFMGSGQTAIAAIETGRVYTGYERDAEYQRLCETRITEYQLKKHVQQ